MPEPQRLAPVQREILAQQLAALLEPCRLPADEYSASYEPDQDIRLVVRRALQILGVYDGGGCPLCLS